MSRDSIDDFLEACGASEPLRINVEEQDVPVLSRRVFTQPFLVIGRKPQLDLYLDHYQISRRHAYLQYVAGRYFCVDLGSRSGLQWGGATHRKGWLEPGQALEIGPYRLRPEDDDDFAALSDPAEDPRLPAVTWEFIGRAGAATTWRMDGRLALVGRSSACDIQLSQPISKFHCSLVLTPRGVWVVDLLGEKGTFVNDERVRWARLHDGDELRVGLVVLRPHFGTYPKAAPPPEPPPEPAAEPVRTAAPLTALSSSRAFLPATPEPVASRGPGTGLATTTPVSGPIATTTADPLLLSLVQQFGSMQQQMFDQFQQTMLTMFEAFGNLHRDQMGSLRAELDQVRRLNHELEALQRESVARQEAPPHPPDSRRPPSPRPPRRDPAPASSSDSARFALPHNGPRETGPSATRADSDLHALLYQKIAALQTERQTRWQKILNIVTNHP